MPVSHAYRCLFVHIPKTGGTSIEHALGLYWRRRREDRDALFGPIESADIQRRGFASAYLQHLTMAEIRALYHPEWPFGGYFTFAFVRNPWDRMVSSFSKKDGHLVRTARARGLELEGVSFPEYVRLTAEVPDHAHMLPQYRFVTDDTGAVDVDFVGRFESLAEDFDKVRLRLGIESRLPHEKRSARRDGLDYRRYYTEETQRVVAARYAGDIELFGYEF